MLAVFPELVILRWWLVVMKDHEKQLGPGHDVESSGWAWGATEQGRGVACDLLGTSTRRLMS
jgi:hypothetical protein